MNGTIIVYRTTPMGLNSTRTHHRFDPIDLMTECTVCETLSREGSPTMEALGITRPYGALLGEFLVRNGLLKQGSTVVELGCGYGSLMEGLLRWHGAMVRKAVMVDISPRLIRTQRARLAAHAEKTRHVMADIHSLPLQKGCVDLVIANEVMGDLDTVTDLDGDALPGDVSGIVEAYALDIPPQGRFNLNIGAIRLVEGLCRLGCSFFLSEHASDPLLPESMPYLAGGLGRENYPRRIPLVRHDEYTIRFSHLEKVARAWGREVKTGPLFDVLGIDPAPSWRFIFTARACADERHACVYEFLDHVREYRWMAVV